jgi:hypothetical protein
VAVGIAGEGADEAHVVDAGAEVGEELGDVHAGLATLVELVGAFEEG